MFADLPMEVCDAEWQFDHKKLTLYYTSRERVDFRELVRELFRTFKARIWMCVSLFLFPIALRTRLAHENIGSQVLY